MKMNVKNGKEAVEPKSISAGQSVLPFFISPLINGNYFCLDTRDITPVILTGYRVPGFKGENVLHDCKYKTIQGSRVASGREFKNLSRHGALSENFHNYTPGSKCLEKHLSITSLNLLVYGKKISAGIKKNSIIRTIEFGVTIHGDDFLKNKLSITNITKVIKQKLFNKPAAVLKTEPAAVARKNLNFYGGAITKNQG
jgi:hypothetical protein